MKNYAGHSGDELDDALALELSTAGIEVHRNSFAQRGEVETKVIGTVHGWIFKRLWYYWAAEGPGIPHDIATELWEADTNKVVRVDGHCGAPSPLEWYKGFGVGHYHIDTQEGLALLVAALNKTAERVLPENVALNNAVD